MINKNYKLQVGDIIEIAVVCIEGRIIAINNNDITIHYPDDGPTNHYTYLLNSIYEHFNLVKSKEKILKPYGIVNWLNQYGGCKCG
jgi:hypothetical protein